MKIDIICVGKIKEKFYRDAASEYLKRLSRYAALNVQELQDEKTPDKASDKEVSDIKSREGERILKCINPDAYVITLEILGRQYTSEGLAEMIQELGVRGMSHIQFVIGGSLGLADEVIRAADCHLSFSKMTFPHQLMRVILLEQIYRSFRIISGEPYHK